MPDLSNGKNTDFFFMAREDPEVAAAEIVELVKKKLPKYYRVPLSTIQVLTPMQRGVVGAANLNQVLQEAVNPGAEGLRRGGVEYRLHDKVMQIRNNYDKEVFNGDIGVVTAVNLEDRELVVTFDEREITYDVTELDELVLAYATTIHKSQGSEYEDLDWCDVIVFASPVYFGYLTAQTKTVIDRMWAWFNLPDHFGMKKKIVLISTARGTDYSAVLDIQRS